MNRIRFFGHNNYTQNYAFFKCIKVHKSEKSKKERNRSANNFFLAIFQLGAVTTLKTKGTQGKCFFNKKKNLLKSSAGY